MATTLGETASAVTVQLGAEESACATGAAALLVVVRAEGDDSTSVLVTAYVPALASTAATTAIAPSSASLRDLAG
jgi:hypothetical protein